MEQRALQTSSGDSMIHLLHDLYKDAIVFRRNKSIPANCFNIVVAQKNTRARRATFMDRLIDVGALNFLNFYR